MFRSMQSRVRNKETHNGTLLVDGMRSGASAGTRLSHRLATQLAFVFKWAKAKLWNHDAHDSANDSVALVVCGERYFSLSLSATDPRNL